MFYKLTHLNPGSSASGILWDRHKILGALQEEIGPWWWVLRFYNLIPFPVHLPVSYFRCNVVRRIPLPAAMPFLFAAIPSLPWWKIHSNTSEIPPLSNCFSPGIWSQQILQKVQSKYHRKLFLTSGVCQLTMWLVRGMWQVWNCTLEKPHCALIRDQWAILVGVWKTRRLKEMQKVRAKLTGLQRVTKLLSGTRLWTKCYGKEDDCILIMPYQWVSLNSKIMVQFDGGSSNTA